MNHEINKGCYVHEPNLDRQWEMLAACVEPLTGGKLDLRAMRKRRGLTQGDLAKLAGVTAGSVSVVERLSHAFPMARAKMLRVLA